MTRPRAHIPSLALLALVLVVPRASAGIYNFAEPPDELRDFMKFRGIVLNLRDLSQAGPARWGDPAKLIPGKDRRSSENDTLQRYLLVMRLVEKEPWDKLTLEQKLNVSGYLLRCGRTFEARELLERTAREEPDNFLILANLASAYFQLGEMQRAIDYQNMALDAWKVHFDELTPEVRAFVDKMGLAEFESQRLRRVETYWLALMKLRAAEERKGLKDWKTIDALFTDKKGEPVNFMNAKGEYDPGKVVDKKWVSALPEAEKAKLPDDALEIVQQLLLWRPTDNRLFWQYGLLLVEKGFIAEAKIVFDKDLGKVIETRDFREQKRVLEKIRAPGPAVDAPFDDAEKGIESLTPTPYPTRDVVLSFFGGAVVALFAYWQLREIRRRHQRPTA